MALVDAFYRLLVAADCSVARTGDSQLERIVESVWREVRSRHTGAAGRCTMKLQVGKHRLRCIYPRRHEEECSFLLEVRRGKGDLTFRPARPERYDHAAK